MNAAVKHALSAAAVLGTVSLAGLGLTALTFHKTETRILENERLALLSQLTAVIPPARYDNDLINDTLTITDLSPESPEKTLIYRARKKGEPIAAVFKAISPNGYSGNITLLVAVNTDGTLSGVRTISHNETPGLGDKLETARSDWILSFNGKSLDNTGDTQWAVKRDGGRFDQFTGATMTPRAVVGAVKQMLDYFKQNQTRIFLLPDTGEH